MADFDSKLRWLSERGNPVGAEELIERIEADLAGDPLVVVSKRREGTLMTKTQQTPTTGQPSRSRGPVWAVAAFVVVLAVAGISWALVGGDDPVANPTQTTIVPTPTTVAPDVEAMTDLQVIEAAVDALYSGDAERAAELFELPIPHDDDWILAEAAYQAGIDARTALNCHEGTTRGTYSCHMPYHNAMTDAIGYLDSGDTIEVIVKDGAIRDFGFPVHSTIDISMGLFLGRDVHYGAECGIGLFPEPTPRKPECDNLIMDNLDEWAAQTSASEFP